MSGTEWWWSNYMMRETKIETNSKAKINDTINTSGSCQFFNLHSDENPLTIPVTCDLLRVRTRCPRRTLMYLTSTCPPGWPMGTIACRACWVPMGRSWAAWSWRSRFAPTSHHEAQSASRAKFRCMAAHTHTAELRSTGGFRFLISSKNDLHRMSENKLRFTDCVNS